MSTRGPRPWRHKSIWYGSSLALLLNFFFFGSNMIVLCVFVCLLVCIPSCVVKEDAMATSHAAQEEPIHGDTSSYPAVQGRHRRRMPWTLLPPLVVMCCFSGHDVTSLLFRSSRRIPCPWLQQEPSVRNVERRTSRRANELQ